MTADVERLARELMAQPLERLRRWHANRCGRPLYGGDADPTARELLLEFWEQRILTEEAEAANGTAPPAYEEPLEEIKDPAVQWQEAERRIRELEQPYVPQVTGDPVVDEWERRLALGLNPYEEG